MMDKLALNKGFTLIEVILVLMIGLGSSVLFQKPNLSRVQNSNEFKSTLIHLQFMALLTHTTLEYAGEVITDYPVRYNANGNINMGQTILFNSKRITLLIGTGKIHEKRIYDD